MTGAALLAGASPVSAHAELESSDPASGAVLASAPRQVTLIFGEPVERAATAIEVFDDHLRSVPTVPVAGGDTGRIDDNRLAVTLPPGMTNGTYTVTWQVSSTDTHPVSGSFRFSVGAPSTVTGSAPGTTRNDLAGLLLGGARGIGYAGLALGPGLLLVVLALWRRGLSDRRTRALIWCGFGLLVTSTLVARLLQGVWAGGQPISAIWSSPGDLDTRSRRFDQIYAVRSYLVLAFGCAVLAALAYGPAKSPAADPRPGLKGSPRAEPDTSRLPWWVLSLAVATSMVLMATWAMAGHAATDSVAPLTIAVNLIHLMALSTWLGGLAMVAFSLRPASRADDLAAVMPRFSRLAFSCVTALVLSGVYLAWREVGSLAALWSTEYGRVLLVKLTGVLALVVLGNLARRWVQRHLPSPPHRPAMLLVSAGIVPVGQMTFRPLGYGPAQLARLHRGIAAELGIAGAVLALSSALMVLVPARQDYVVPFHRTVSTADLRVDLDLASPKVGEAILRGTVKTPAGRPVAITAMRGTITLASPRLGPLALQPLSGSGASASGAADLKVSLPAQGTWTLQLTVQTSSVDATALTAPLAVS